jgi:hypothetical protein
MFQRRVSLTLFSCKTRSKVIQNALSTSSSERITYPKSEKQLEVMKRKAVRKEIDNLFNKRDISLENMDNFIREKLKDCHTAEVACLMRQSGKRSKYTNVLTEKHMSAVSHRLEVLSESKWGMDDASNIIYGLQNENQDSAGVLRIISTMAKVADKTLKYIQIRDNNLYSPKQQDIMMILLGLQNITSEKRETLELLSVITHMIKICTEIFKPETLSSSLFGMRKMNSDCPEVRFLIIAMVSKMVECSENFNQKEACLAISGIQNMKSDSPEVCLLLSALAIKVEHCGGIVKAEALGDMLYSFQHMSSEVPEVCTLLSVLVAHIEMCECTLRPESICDSLYGMQNMSSDSPIVRALLSALTPNIKTSKEKLDSKALKDIFYGIRNMKNDCPEVQALLSILSLKALDSDKFQELREKY